MSTIKNEDYKIFYPIRQEWEKEIREISLLTGFIHNGEEFKKLDKNFLIDKEIICNVLNNGFYSIYINHDNRFDKIYYHRKITFVYVNYKEDYFKVGGDKHKYKLKDFNKTWFIDFNKWKEKFKGE